MGEGGWAHTIPPLSETQPSRKFATSGRRSEVARLTAGGKVIRDAKSPADSVSMRYSLSLMIQYRQARSEPAHFGVDVQNICGIEKTGGSVSGVETWKKIGCAREITGLFMAHPATASASKLAKLQYRIFVVFP